MTGFKKQISEIFYYIKLISITFPSLRILRVYPLPLINQIWNLSNKNNPKTDNIRILFQPKK
ncbi:hypothetical protein CSB69_1084 [Morganella morganii]|nr:hypothetical protein CSB69_1084 [Morganella morganii]